jgi:nitroreductase
MSLTDAANPDLSDAALLRERYGADALPAAGSLNQVLRSLLAHRSVRAYLPDALPASTLEALVAAAQSASSSSNLQTWSVIAVEDPGRKARLAQVAGGQAHIEQAPLFLVWLADLSRLERVAVAKGRELEARDYLETFIVAAVDAALAAQNAAVAAESMGLGTVYIGALRNDPERVAAELGLPPHVMAVFGLCVGYADPAKPTAIKPRLPQPVVLFRERYAPQDELENVARYDQTLAAFSRGQGMGNVTWTGRVLARFASLAGMNGRERMRAMMKALGFELR